MSKKERAGSFVRVSARSSYLRIQGKYRLLVKQMIEIKYKQYKRGSTHRMVFLPRLFALRWLSFANLVRKSSAASVVIIAVSFYTMGVSGSSFNAFLKVRNGIVSPSTAGGLPFLELVWGEPSVVVVSHLLVTTEPR